MVLSLSCTEGRLQSINRFYQMSNSGANLVSQVSSFSSMAYTGNMDGKNYIKGFRFHPTDKEAIELLWEKTVLNLDSVVEAGDSVVQVITQLEDICNFEPWDLPDRSVLDSGDDLWYYFCTPRYKYRNSKRKNRVTKAGYWKPTGKPREIVTTINGNEIKGSRQTLVFQNGRVGVKRKIENKASWVVEEFQLTFPNQESLTFCKLKKKNVKADVSRVEEKQSSQGLPANLENQDNYNSIPKDQLNSNEPLGESIAVSGYSGIQYQVTMDGRDDIDEFVDSILIDKDPYFAVENEGLKIHSGHQIHAPDTDVPQKQEGFYEQMNQKPEAPNDIIGNNIEYDNSSWSSILTAINQTSSKEGSGSFLAQNEGSCLALQNHVAVDSIHALDEFFENGIFMAELPVAVQPEAPMTSNEAQNNQSSTNEQNDDEYWNSMLFTTDEVEAYPEVFRSREQNSATENEGFNFSNETMATR